MRLNIFWSFDFLSLWNAYSYPYPISLFGSQLLNIQKIARDSLSNDTLEDHQKDYFEEEIGIVWILKDSIKVDNFAWNYFKTYYIIEEDVSTHPKTKIKIKNWCCKYYLTETTHVLPK